MKRTIGFIISLVVVVAIAGLVIFRLKNKDTTQSQQYGLLKPQPGETINIRNFNDGGTSQQTNNPQNPPAQNPPVQNAPVQQPSNSPKTTTLRSSGKVLGTETQSKPAPAPKYTSTPIARSTAVSTASTSTISATPTTSTYNLSELSFGVTVPATVRPVLETRVGNVVAFYNSDGSRYGEVEVLANAYESFSALVREIQANSNASNITQITVDGQPALIYDDRQFGRTIALVYKNNVYYLRGAFSSSALSKFKLL